MADPNFHISTPRLYLSYLQASLDTHCDFLVALYNSPEVLIANEGIATPFPDREAARKTIQSRAEWQDKTGYGNYLVSLRPLRNGELETSNCPFFDRLKDCQFIGTVSMKIRPHPKAPLIPDVGFSLLRPHWGKGYATEATRALLNYFEKERGVRQVFGFSNPTNADSRRMFLRLAFEDRGVRLVKCLGKEGVNAQVWTNKGVKEDLSVYGL